MGNVVAKRKTRVSAFRKIAIGTWQTAKDPSVYGSMEVEMDEALAYIAAFREQTGRRLTVTHLVGKVVAAVLEEMPDANAILRFNRIYLRKDIGIFFQVVMEDPFASMLMLQLSMILVSSSTSATLI